MLKLMIVDDEITVRSGLQKLFNWNDLGFEPPIDASNGVEALELYHRCKPDVIITDICMDEKSGLELLAEVKHLTPHTEFIILTGYADFHYVKNSLENNAFAYLLKPIQTAELYDCLERVKAKIYERGRDTRERFFFKLLQISLPTAEAIEALCKKYAVTLPACPFFVSVLQIDGSRTLQLHAMYDTLCDMLHSSFYGHSHVFICQPKGDYVAFLGFCTNPRMSNTLLSMLNDVKAKFSAQTGLSLTVGISETSGLIPFVRDAFLQALYAVSQKVIKGYGLLIHYPENSDNLNEDLLKTSFFINSGQIAEILAGIQSFNRTAVTDIIDAYFGKLALLESINVDIIKNNVSELAMQIINFSAETPEQAKLIYGEIPQPITEIQKLDLIDDIRSYLNDLIEKIFNHREIQLSKKYSKLIYDAQIYIMTHYAVQLSIEDISKAVHTERTYLMSLFKNETGMTINKFLTDYRVKIAIDLLKSRKYQVQEIAPMVGYSDTKYFSKVFKKNTGRIPSDYLGGTNDDVSKA